MVAFEVQRSEILHAFMVLSLQFRQKGPGQRRVRSFFFGISYPRMIHNKVLRGVWPILVF